MTYDDHSVWFVFNSSWFRIIRQMIRINYWGVIDWAKAKYFFLFSKYEEMNYLTIKEFNTSTNKLSWLQCYQNKIVHWWYLWYVHQEHDHMLIHKQIIYNYMVYYLKALDRETVASRHTGSNTNGIWANQREQWWTELLEKSTANWPKSPFQLMRRDELAGASRARLNERNISARLTNNSVCELANGNWAG